MDPTFKQKEDGSIEATFSQPKASKTPKRTFQMMIILAYSTDYYVGSPID